MREKIARFMQGRYGVDQFSNFLVMAAVVLMVLEMFIRIPLVRMIFNTVTLVLIVYAYVRILSKNITAGLKILPQERKLIWYREEHITYISVRIVNRV